MTSPKKGAEKAWARQQLQANLWISRNVFHLEFLPMLEISGYIWVFCSHCRLISTVQLICRVKGFCTAFMMTDKKWFANPQAQDFILIMSVCFLWTSEHFFLLDTDQNSEIVFDWIKPSTPHPTSFTHHCLTRGAVLSCIYWVVFLNITISAWRVQK